MVGYQISSGIHPKRVDRTFNCECEITIPALSIGKKSYVLDGHMLKFIKLVLDCMIRWSDKEHVRELFNLSGEIRRAAYLDASEKDEKRNGEACPVASSYSTPLS